MSGMGSLFVVLGISFVDPVEFTEGGTPEELFHGVDYLSTCPVEYDVYPV